MERERQMFTKKTTPFLVALVLLSSLSNNFAIRIPCDPIHPRRHCWPRSNSPPPPPPPLPPPHPPPPCGSTLPSPALPRPPLPYEHPSPPPPPLPHNPTTQPPPPPPPLPDNPTTQPPPPPHRRCFPPPDYDYHCRRRCFPPDDYHRRPYDPCRVGCCPPDYDDPPN